MPQNKKLKKTDLSITIILLLGILVVVNFFSYQLFFRWDLTENKVFSVSDATKNTLQDLDDIVNIKAYFSANLPNQVLSVKQEVADILNEYEAYSDGKIRAEFVDPQDDKDLQQELAILGIPQLTFEVYEKDNLQLVNGYMGIAVSFGGETEVIPAVKRNTSGLEYQLTTAVKKVATDDMAVIGYLASQGTRDRENELKALMQNLGELYSIQNVTLGEEEPAVPAGIDTLLLIGPTEDFSEDQLKALNSFLARGGAMLALVDGVTVGEGLNAAKNPSNIITLLGKYGINLGQDLVADQQSGLASFSQGFMTFSSKYPFWPKVENSGFSQENSAVANLESVVFPWVSSVAVDSGKTGEDKFQYLAHTTGRAWKVADNFNISPNASQVPQGQQGEFNLVALVNGPVPNAYPEEGEEANINAKIIVAGDSDFTTDNFTRNSPDNVTLAQNLVDVLSFDEDLINIRSKGATSRPIEEMSESAKAAMRYLNVFGVTVLVIAFGLVRYFLRRRSRFIDEI